MLEAIPVLLTRDQGYWIEAVLRPLIAVFGIALVGDGGSTDCTREIVKTVAGAELFELGEMNPRQLGEARQALGFEAIKRGAGWILHVQGDELYSEVALRAIAEQGMPVGKVAGMVTLASLSCCGQAWKLESLFKRLAILPAQIDWIKKCSGQTAMALGQKTRYCLFDLPAGLRYHAICLRRIEQNPWDAEVYLQGGEEAGKPE